MRIDEVERLRRPPRRKTPSLKRLVADLSLDNAILEEGK